jgi:hypothetical protein
MGSDNADLAEELEIDGTVPEIEENEDILVPEGARKHAIESLRRHVERERETVEMEQAAQPDPEFFEKQAEFRELMTERLAEEFGLLEEYEELRDRRAAEMEEIEDAMTSITETTDGESE